MSRQTNIQVRRGTASDWSSVNPTLAQGEPGFETDTNKMKLGDGSTAWNSLPYFAVDGGSLDGGGGATTTTAAPTTTTTAAPTDCAGYGYSCTPPEYTRFFYQEDPASIGYGSDLQACADFYGIGYCCGCV